MESEVYCYVFGPYPSDSPTTTFSVADQQSRRPSALFFKTAHFQSGINRYTFRDEIKPHSQRIHLLLAFLPEIPQAILIVSAECSEVCQHFVLQERVTCCQQPRIRTNHHKDFFLEGWGETGCNFSGKVRQPQPFQSQK